MIEEFDKNNYYRTSSIEKGDGTKRKIFAPSPSLLELQQSKIPVLNTIYFNKIRNSPIYSCAHAFIIGRNCVTAAERHIGFKCTINIDIKDFFNSVKKKHFEDIPEIFYEEKLFHKKGEFCAQGFASSPMLANIASLRMLYQIELYLKDLEFEYEFTIYADDIQISINEESRAREIRDRVYQIIEMFDFDVKKSKTRFLYSKFGYRTILGIAVGDKEIRPTRATKKKMRAALHQGNMKSYAGLKNWATCYAPKKRTS